MKIEALIKQGKFEDNYQKALVNLMYTGNWLRDKQQSLFREYDLLPQHYNILRIIRGRHPKPVSPGEIKEVMLDKGNDVTRLLDKLVKRRLVCRSLCEENRRKMDVTLTPDGLQLLEEVEKPLQQLFNEVKQRLTDAEALQLSNLLDQLRDAD